MLRTHGRYVRADLPGRVLGGEDWLGWRGLALWAWIGSRLVDGVASAQAAWLGSAGVAILTALGCPHAMRIAKKNLTP